MKSILVVDDSPINLKLVTKALESTYKVIAKVTGKEALDKITAKAV